MDDALVEKVARAMYDGHLKRSKPWESESAFQRQRWIASARAVLALPDLRLAGVKEGLEMAAKECDGLATTAAAIQCNLELSGYAAPIKAMQRETAEALATAIRSLGPRP